MREVVEEMFGIQASAARRLRFHLTHLRKELEEARGESAEDDYEALGGPVVVDPSVWYLLVYRVDELYVTDSETITLEEHAGHAPPRGNGFVIVEYKDTRRFLLKKEQFEEMSGVIRKGFGMQGNETIKLRLTHFKEGAGLGGLVEIDESIWYLVVPQIVELYVIGEHTDDSRDSASSPLGSPRQGPGTKFANTSSIQGLMELNPSLQNSSPV
ncbi:hypothetical protein V5O48_003233 [Marasmius crinis-equi]|uniref:Uncharacterized protein n=1 Tax=Marasmius crinis-equi TaxID=585013 RepID=A0ABR3FTH9_9AGAR